jgi:putative FmdB family regulatory protein
LTHAVSFDISNRRCNYNASGEIMPIYEYYCKKCNTIFNFLSKTFSVEKEPICPRCKGDLKKHVSSFAFSQKMKGPDSLPMSTKMLDEGMKRLKDHDTKDPEDAARLRKKFSNIMGVNFEEGKKKSDIVLESEYDEKRMSVKDKPVSDEHDAPPERDETLYEI